MISQQINKDSQAAARPAQLGSALLAVSGLTFISRILGLARDIVIASVFAVGAHTDAFFVAFKIPNVLRRLTAEGAFTQAFVPAYNSVRTKHGDAAAAALRDQACIWLTLILSAIVVIGIIAAPAIVILLAPGFAGVEGKLEITADLLRIVFPYLLLISLTAFCGGVLNSFGRFSAFAFAPALLNICMIAAAIWLAPLLNQPVFALALGVIAGGCAQLLLQLAALARIRNIPRPAWPRLNEQITKLLMLTGQGAFGVAASQISIALSLVFASFLAEGSVTWLYFADRLMELPAGMIGAALATVALPTLARHAAAADSDGFSETLDWGLRTAMLFALPAATGLAFLAEPLCATLFQHGEFTPQDSKQTAKAVIAYAIGVPALVSVRLLAAGFTSRLDVMTPVKVSVAALIITTVLYFFLSREFAHAGLALAVALGATVNAAALLILHMRRRTFVLQPGWLKFIMRVLVACAVMILVLRIHDGKGDFTEAHAVERIWRLALAIGSGAACYFIILYLLGIRLKDFVGSSKMSKSMAKS